MPAADLLHFLIDRKIKESYVGIGRAGHAGTENVASLRRVGVTRRKLGCDQRHSEEQVSAADRSRGTEQPGNKLGGRT
jgi:hypothetical protein